VEYIQKILEDIGVEPRRLQMINVSAAMGGQFAWSAAELTAEIKRMGPNPLGGNNFNPALEEVSTPPEMEGEGGV
jgi:coenzyme F420-reducing hydrogenase delta subunit